ncbi:MAG: hypothetical protein AAFX99_26310 [Myxococcota bacterium]
MVSLADMLLRVVVARGGGPQTLLLVPNPPRLELSGAAPNTGPLSSTLNNLECPTGTQRRLKTSKKTGKAAEVWCADAQGNKQGPELRAHFEDHMILNTFKDGVRSGRHRVIREGKVVIEGRFEGGKAHGHWCTWNSDGTHSSEGRYHHDRKVGIWLEWSNSGDIKQCDYTDPNTPESVCKPPAR